MIADLIQFFMETSAKEIDLSLESSEKLEKIDKKTLDKWTWEQEKVIGISVGLFLLGIIALYFNSSPEKQNTDLIGHIISAPKNFLNLIFVLAMLACVVISPFIFIIYIVRLVLGISKAPKDPIITIKRFYSKTINENNGIPEIDASAYMLMLDQAKLQFKDVNVFIDQNKEIVKKLKADIGLHFGSDGGRNNYNIKTINEVGSDPILKNYEIYIEAKHSIQTSIAPETHKTLGSITILERCTVAHVGERWYMTSGNWTGKFET